MSFLASQLGCRGLRVVQVEDTVTGNQRGASGRHGAIILELYGPENTDFLNYVRSLAVANDGGRWAFDQAGTPQPFEELDRYQARSVRERFTSDALDRYLRALGVRAFDEGFYLPGPDARAALIEKVGPSAPNAQEFTLDAVRTDF